MKTKFDKIYRIANKCGFEVKHREESENTVFAFKDKDSDLKIFFEVCAKNVENEKTFCENVAHAVFLFSEDFDPHTETITYLEKIGGNLQKYTCIYSEIVSTSWKIRNLWYSL